MEDTGGWSMHRRIVTMLHKFHQNGMAGSITSLITLVMNCYC
uniref:Uncharacterized protein n=1 Tax=Solanum lycopersicum TaxID=4081 RepID=A0A3Q7FQ58_SOLLC